MSLQIRKGATGQPGRGCVSINRTTLPAQHIRIGPRQLEVRRAGQVRESQSSPDCLGNW
jgi:hypothetical protein